MSDAAPLILIVEDEPKIADTVVYALQTEGFATHWVTHGGAALRELQRLRPALVLLDIGLPDMNGFDVCRELRKASDVPVVFLTARSDEVDCVVGLEIGGDDYITKPFSPRVLTARVRARLRKPAPPAVAAATGGGFEVDRDAYQVRLDGASLGLSRYEYRILQLLIDNPRRVYTRAQLLDLVWEEPERSFDRTVDTHIKTIRQKIRALDDRIEPIRTHRGIGYSFEP